jgi:hypothetical protein
VSGKIFDGKISVSYLSQIVMKMVLSECTGEIRVMNNLNWFVIALLTGGMTFYSTSVTITQYW